MSIPWKPVPAEAAESGVQVPAPLDPEVQAINSVLLALAPLDHRARARVLRFSMGKAVNQFLRQHIEAGSSGEAV